MWETRDAERHYLSSKVLCWVALDRAVQLAPRLGDRADPRRWAAIRDEIRATVLREGWNDRIGAYTGAFGSAELDASVLFLPVVQLPAGHRPADALHHRGGGAGAGHRRRAGPALEHRPGRLRALLVLAGGVPGDGRRADRARALFEQVLGHANDLGLFAEQIDLSTGEQLGNTPQALSHIGLINAAWRLTDPDTA